MTRPLTHAAVLLAMVILPMAGGVSDAASGADGPATAPATQPSPRPITEIAKPTLVTLKLNNATLKDTLAALESASKNKISVAPTNLLARTEGEVTLDMTQKPWLEVLMEICRQTNLSVSNYSDTWTLSAGGDRRLRGRQWLSGSVLISCNNLQLETDLRYGQPARSSRTLTLNGLMAVEPRVPVTSIIEVRDVVAIDDRGRELPGATEERSIYIGGERRDFRFGITLPDDVPARLDVVRGTLIANAMSSTVDLKIPDLLNPDGKSVALNGAEFKVNSAEKNGIGFLVEIEATAGNFPKDLFQRMSTGMITPNARIGEDRRTGEVRVSQYRAVGERSVVTLYVRPMDRRNADDPPPNITLTWVLPVGYQTVAIPFEFKDIPLPQ